MSLYAQHGFRKSDYMEQALTNGHIKGVILSPRDLAQKKMAKYVEKLKSGTGANATILFDPQFYSVRMGAQRRYLRDYDYYPKTAIGQSSFSQGDIQKYSSAIVDCQTNMKVDKILSPAIKISDFTDFWSEVTMKLAHSTIDHTVQQGVKSPLLISIVFDEQALKNENAVDEFLDEISLLKAAGFYLVMNPAREGTTYPAPCDSDALAKFLYFVYVLSKGNDKEVVCGYSDFVGIPLHAVGASATATGWFAKQRQFSPRIFERQGGRGGPEPRYSSRPLISSIRFTAELTRIEGMGELQSVLSGTSYDRQLEAGLSNAAWKGKNEYLHHWAILSELILMASSGKDVYENLLVVERLIAGALSRYEKLGDKVEFRETSSKTNLLAWQNSIARFREKLVNI